MEEQEFALPIFEQRLERSLRLKPFLDYVEKIINQPISDDEDDDSDSEIFEEYLKDGLPGTDEEKRADRAFMYNFSSLKKSRLWLKEVLISSSESESDQELTNNDLMDMIREHKLRKKHQSQFYQKGVNSSYMYYSSGVLSRVDRYPEHQKFLAVNKRKKEKEKKEEKRNEVSKLQSLKVARGSSEDITVSDFCDESNEEINLKVKSKASKKEKKPKKLDAQALAIRRHKLWVLMAKKEVGKCQKSKSSFRKEVLQNCKKMAAGCMRHCRQKALQSQKTVKDKVWLLKRLTRTMQTEWKKFDRIMKEQNKRAEREAEEQRKIDKEILEAKRQQRKMNFLITLPELYSHFMKNKLNSNLGADDGTYSILKQLEDEKPLPASVTDDYDCDAMKAQALKTAKDAYSSQLSRVNIFGDMQNPLNNVKPKEYGQPAIFNGQLKSYQLKGMNWLANLYYFGINGILADEMGLGKTVQSVAFLGHICEEYDTWGPFLIVTPASTLHNWNCEISRFVPIFKVVPYWGNPEERKNLRKFFDGKNLGTREASFHLVVTSYQIVIQDFKFLNRLKWNYMILDEAQAIKSINSQRWKQLLGFSCRNRLLLSGTPIQNSMAELWALLHFIMPTLFDSHNWFNEWFSKDIEGHVENKTTVDEKHLNRLHLILKPFMLRRVKTEVENELSDKIEIMMYCPLTLRQKYLYDGLKNKISIDELLRSSMNNQTTPSVTTSLMNLVMQFRKVCNHPELLERREVKSPFNINPEPFVLPKLVYREALLQHSLPSQNYLLQNMFSIFHPDYIFSSLEKENIEQQLKCFSFIKFVDTSVGELSKIALEGILIRWILYLSSLQKALIRRLNREWGESHIKPAGSIYCKKDCRLIDPHLCSAEIKTSEVLSNLVFTSPSSTFYSFTDHIIHSVPETLPHRLIRSKKFKNKVKIEEIYSTYEDVEVKQEPLDDVGTTCNDVLAINSSSVDSPKGEEVSPSKISSSVGLAQSRIPRKSNSKYARKIVIKSEVSDITHIEDDTLVPEFIHIERDPVIRTCQSTFIPTFLLHTCPKAQSLQKNIYVYDRSAAYMQDQKCRHSTTESLSSVMFGRPQLEDDWRIRHLRLHPPDVGGMWASYPKLGWNNTIIPDKHTLIMDAGKLYVLDSMLCKLKAGAHRVLIYSQMTKMIDLLEEYMWHRKHKYMRLDGSSKISDRRDMVEDFQNKSDIFVFLLSTRAGGVGINLTAADTVIFYDSDWNPTVDQQAMDRAHRLGQTKQVTVYRLICKSTIEERILQRAREKSEIQRMVISGGNFKPDSLKPKEVVSLLLDDDIEKEYRAKQAERRYLEETKLEINREKMRERMRKRYAEKKLERAYEEKRRRLEDSGVIDVCGDETPLNSCPPSPAHSDGSYLDNLCSDDETNDSSSLNVLDVESNSPGSTFSSSTGNDNGQCGQLNQNLTPSRRHKKRGRPRGSGARGRGARASDCVQVVNGTSSGAISGEDFQDTTNDNNSSPPGPYTSNSKRGRGRPRLLPLGPGHQGFRPSPTLPVALGSSLGNNLGTFTLKDANGSNQSNFYFSP